jgi:hypothetical protein
MAQTPEEGPSLSAPARAEQILSRAGERLGILAGQTMQRFRQQASHAEGEQNLPMPEAPDQPRTSEKAAYNGQAPATERAEHLVSRTGERVGHWVTVGNWQVRRTMARMREDAEDMWHEAQNMRRNWRG